MPDVDDDEEVIDIENITDDELDVSEAYDDEEEEVDVESVPVQESYDYSDATPDQDLGFVEDDELTFEMDVDNDEEELKNKESLLLWKMKEIIARSSSAPGFDGP